MHSRRPRLCLDKAYVCCPIQISRVLPHIFWTFSTAACHRLCSCWSEVGTDYKCTCTLNWFHAALFIMQEASMLRTLTIWRKGSASMKTVIFSQCSGNIYTLYGRCKQTYLKLRLLQGMHQLFIKSGLYCHHITLVRWGSNSLMILVLFDVQDLLLCVKCIIG